MRQPGAGQVQRTAKDAAACAFLWEGLRWTHGLVHNDASKYAASQIRNTFLVVAGRKPRATCTWRKHGFGCCGARTSRHYHQAAALGGSVA